MGKYGQIIMGPAGAGKSTFTARIQEHVHARGKSLHVVNLDPAAEHFAYDVAVDIRVGSPTFGQWVSMELQAGDGRLLYVPPGFAHGFTALSDGAAVLYKCSDFYAPDDQFGILFDDPKLGIEWPVDEPVLVARDRQWPSLETAGDTLFDFESLS